MKRKKEKKRKEFDVNACLIDLNKSRDPLARSFSIRWVFFLFPPEVEGTER